MNYFLLINAFYESLEIKPLKPPAIALWHALANIANKAGWPDNFTIAIQVLSVRTGMDRRMIERGRNTLAQSGYITWKSRGGNLCATYQLEPLYDKNVQQSVVQPVVQSVVQSVVQPVVQSVAINKQEHKHKHKQDLYAWFDLFWSSYPKQKSKGDAEKAFKSLNPTAEKFENILQSLEKAKKQDSWTKDNGQYIPYPATWIRAKGWEDDLSVKTSKAVVGSLNSGKGASNGVSDRWGGTKL